MGLLRATRVHTALVPVKPNGGADGNKTVEEADECHVQAHT